MMAKNYWKAYLTKHLKPAVPKKVAFVEPKVSASIIEVMRTASFG